MKKLVVKVAKKEKKTVNIQTDYIRLDAALKLADAVQTGGHAKLVITEGDVKEKFQLKNAYVLTLYFYLIPLL